MRQIFLILTFILSTLLSFGQSEHLKPVRDFTKYDGELKDYYVNVFPLLYKGFSEKPIARYTAMPSFSSEYCFSLEIINSKRYIVSHTLSTNYWYARGNRENVESISSKTELRDDLFSKIVQLFYLLDEQTKDPEKDMAGLDGVTYYFFTTDKDGHVKR